MTKALEVLKAAVSSGEDFIGKATASAVAKEVVAFVLNATETESVFVGLEEIVTIMVEVDKHDIRSLYMGDEYVACEFGLDTEEIAAKIEGLALTPAGVAIKEGRLTKSILWNEQRARL